MTRHPLGHLDDPLGPPPSTPTDRVRTKALGARRRRHRRLMVAVPVVAVVAAGAVPLALAVMGGTGTSGLVQQPATSPHPTHPLPPTPVPSSPPSPTTAPPIATKTPTPSPTPVSITRCHVSGMHIALGPMEGAAGSVFRTLTYTNTGTATCTLKGFAGVSFLDAAGQQIGAPASKDPRPVQLVTLRPGKTATSFVSVAQAANYPVDLCRPAPASSIRIYPPGSTVAVVLATPEYPQICTTRTQGGSGGQVHVTPVTAQ